MKDNLLIENINYGDDDSIVSLWKKIFSHNKNADFLYDSLFGQQTRRDFIIKVYLISEYIKKIEGTYIGIMLPAVGSSNILIMATFLAGKVPVMFNWTLSKDAFEHCVTFSKVDKILTATTFYEKINIEYLNNYNNKFIFLDTLLKNISLKEKFLAFSKSLYLPINKIDNKQEAVVLFTSGTETLPKAISLSHENIIENIMASISIFDVKNNDILLGFLPPFHSFGFTVNTIMPLITGLRLVNSPDPKDANAILDLIKTRKITALTTTPTFLKMIMNLASSDELLSVKYVVVGAEKCSKEIFDRFTELAPNGRILEGYGITECSPVISINPVLNGKKGTVGKILGGLDYKILDLENNEELVNGSPGLLCVSGKSVFHGYLDNKIENPFIEIEGKSFYNTGDIGFVDTDGFLTLSGRLKRFVKVAGEMISLPYIEEVLSEKYDTGTNEIAVEALEKDGKTKIVLFSKEEIDVNSVNKYLREKIFSSIIKISEVILLDVIPVLGTGKINYKELKKMITFPSDYRVKADGDLGLEDALKEKIKELSGDKNIDLYSSSIFGKDIHLDSIDVGELMIFIRKKYSISGEIKVANIKTFGELVNLVKNSIK